MRIETDFSGASLAYTLDIQEGARVFVWNGPGDYLDLVRPLPARVRIIKGLDSDTDIVHVFVKARAALERSLRTLHATLRPQAIVWVSWPRPVGQGRPEVNEGVVRAVADELGFDALKMCTVGDHWSALRVAIRAPKQA